MRKVEDPLAPALLGRASSHALPCQASLRNCQGLIRIMPCPKSRQQHFHSSWLCFTCTCQHGYLLFQFSVSTCGLAICWIPIRPFGKISNTDIKLPSVPCSFPSIRGYILGSTAPQQECHIYPLSVCKIPLTFV